MPNHLAEIIKYFLTIETSGLRLVLFVLVACLPTPLLAQGGMSINIGGIESGPMVPNAAATFFNPAALGGTKGFNLLVGVEAVAGQGTYLRAPDDLSAAYPEVSANVLLAIPSLFISNDFGLDKWRFGFGTFVPFGSGGAWDRYGPQRYHLIKGFEGALYMTGALSYEVGKKFHLGAAVSYVLSFLKGSVSLDLGTTAQSFAPPDLNLFAAENPLYEGHAQANPMFGHNVTAAFGAFWQATPKLDVGLSFHLPYKVEVIGTVDIDLPDVLSLADPPTTFIGLDGSRVRADAITTQKRPPLILFGMGYDMTDRLFIEGSVYYVLSRFRDTFTTELFNTGLPYLDSPQGTSHRDTGAGDSFQIKTGARYRLNKQITTGGYLSYINSGVPSTHVSASNIGFDLISPSTFLDYHISDRSSIGTSISAIIAFERLVTNSIFDPLAPANSGIGVPPGNGLYRGYGVQLGITYKWSF